MDKYTGPGSGEDDFADYNQNESNDYREELQDSGEYETEAERNV